MQCTTRGASQFLISLLVYYPQQALLPSDAIQNFT